MKRLLIVCLVTIWCAAVYCYEFRLRVWPTSPYLMMNASEGKPALSPKPIWYGLSNVTLDCARNQGLATTVRLAQQGLSFSIAETRCESGLTNETTRCDGSAPMRSFASLITCARFEKIDCNSKPLQRVGLFSGDSFCGDGQEQDAGAPKLNDRADDP